MLSAIAHVATHVPEPAPLEKDYPSFRSWKQARNRWDHARKASITSQVGESRKRPAVSVSLRATHPDEQPRERTETHAANTALRGLLADTSWILDRDTTLKLVEMSRHGMRAFLDSDADDDRQTRGGQSQHSLSQTHALTTHVILILQGSQTGIPRSSAQHG
jgi:hypothetical protein